MKKSMSKILASAVIGAFALTAAVGFKPVTINAASDTDASESDASGVDPSGDTTYHAYIQIQTPSYTFRNNFNEPSYGREDMQDKNADGQTNNEVYGMDFFNQLTGWDADNKPLTVPGTFKDAEVKGNGTYTISLSDIEFLAGDFSSQETLRMLNISTDIPVKENDEGDIVCDIEFSDIVLTIDGKEVTGTDPIIDQESDEYMQIDIINEYNEDLAVPDYYNTPFTNASVTFTVSGFDVDNPDATGDVAEDTEEADTTESVSGDDTTTAPATEASTTDKDDDSKSFPVVPVVIAVVVVVAAVAAVALKKKK